MTKKISHKTKSDLAKMLARYRVTDGRDFRLRDYAADDMGGGHVDHEAADLLLAAGIAKLAHLQEKLFAQDRWAILAVFQAMDAAGKDGTIAHVMTGVNPQGVLATSFKQPGPEELEHDFLWRAHKAVPPRGKIGIFNRSHYEDVLVARVHSEILDHQRLPDAMRGKKFWKHRLEDIGNFETFLSRQGIVVLKFFLNVSKDEQRRRFLARIDDPAKHWKFSESDLRERRHWDAYQDAYQAAIAATATAVAPWFIVPADTKWYTRLVVVSAMVAALEKLDLKTPAPSADMAAALAQARAALLAE
jgi:PPK2 family polyphosphate:nucleotide phosphotransferase